MLSLRALLLLGVVLPVVLARSCNAPFKPLLGQWCIHVEVTAPSNGYGEPVTWPTAQKGCKKLNADLIAVDSHEKIQALSYHLPQEFPEETNAGFVYWVGGKHVGGGNWQWVKTSASIGNTHLWVPGDPDATSGTYYTKLVPADTVHGRHYLVQESATQVAPGYICEQ